MFAGEAFHLGAVDVVTGDLGFLAAHAFFYFVAVVSLRVGELFEAFFAFLAFVQHEVFENLAIRNDS